MMNNLLSVLLQADPSGKWLFQSEKINTVLVVVLLIWAGIVAYLILMQRNVAKIERELERQAGQKSQMQPQEKDKEENR